MRLDLDIGAEAKLGQQIDGFLESRDSLTGKARIEPGAGVEHGELVKRHLGSGAAAVGRPVDSIVMQHDAAAIGGQPDIELDPGCAQRLRPAEPGQRIFGCRSGGTAMADDPGQDELRHGETL